MQFCRIVQMSSPAKKSRGATVFHESKTICCITKTTSFNAQLSWSLQSVLNELFHKYGKVATLSSQQFSAPYGNSNVWELQLSSEAGNDELTLAVLPFTPIGPGDIHAAMALSVSDEGIELYSTSTVHTFPQSSMTGFIFKIPNKADIFCKKDVVIQFKLEYEDELLEDIGFDDADICQQFSNLYASMDNSDVQFQIGDKMFHAHKLILTQRSPVLAAMFRHDMQERANNIVKIEDVEPETFQALLQYLYTDEIDTTANTCKSLLIAADRFSIPSLKLNCENALIDQLTTATCCELLMFADSHEALNLKKAAKDFIVKSSVEVKKTDGWLKISNERPQLVLETCEY